ncbi:MAG: ddlA [Francisellaceae bacterium]|nr:ddlA [Francisellaceae bacterium]
MQTKISITLICGGKTGEHEISLLSTKNVIQALDKNKYDIHLIGINKKGEWWLHKDINNFLKLDSDPKKISLPTINTLPISLMFMDNKTVLKSPRDAELEINIQVVFPILHGPLGEDGTIQGLLKLMNVAYVGVDVLGSAIGMDKDVAKRLLREAGIATANYRVFNRTEMDNIQFEKLVEQLGLPLFIKPANLGSSVGISKVKNKSEFLPKLLNAFYYDNKVLIEEFIEGREIECAVLGNEQKSASIAGELIIQHDFYSYEAKYLDENGALVEIPANLEPSQMKRIQEISIKATEVLCVEGMARVDFFLKKDGSLYINEINTIPGFTNISMYPKLWEASGLPYKELINKLIDLALERFKRDQALLTHYLNEA